MIGVKSLDRWTKEGSPNPREQFTDPPVKSIQIFSSFCLGWGRKNPSGEERREREEERGEREGEREKRGRDIERERESIWWQIQCG